MTMGMDVLGCGEKRKLPDPMVLNDDNADGDVFLKKAKGVVSLCLLNLSVAR